MIVVKSLHESVALYRDGLAFVINTASMRACLCHRPIAMLHGTDMTPLPVCQ